MLKFLYFSYKPISFHTRYQKLSAKLFPPIIRFKSIIPYIVKLSIYILSTIYKNETLCVQSGVAEAHHMLDLHHGFSLPQEVLDLFRL